METSGKLTIDYGLSVNGAPMIYDTEQGIYVAEILNMGNDVNQCNDEQAMSYAKLFAAAPDLLEALKMASEHIAGGIVEPDSAHMFTYQEQKAYVQGIIIDAINKSRGE